MNDGNIRLTTLDLLQTGTPHLPGQAKRERLPRVAIASSQTALALSAKSVRHDQNGETFLFLLLWVCCVWELGAAFARLLV